MAVLARPIAEVGKVPGSHGLLELGRINSQKAVTVLVGKFKNEIHAAFGGPNAIVGLKSRSADLLVKVGRPAVRWGRCHSSFLYV